MNLEWCYWTQNKLTIVEANTGNDVVTCCRKMFSEWLNTDEHASWDKLIEALRILRLGNVGSGIQQFLRQGEL